MPPRGNVVFVAIARSRDRCIVASHEHASKIDVSGVRRLFEMSEVANTEPDRYISVASRGDAEGLGTWHLVQDSDARTFIVVTASSYPQRIAYSCLNELRRQFVSKVGDKAMSAKEGALSKPAYSLLKSVCEKYDDLAAVDRLSSTMAKIEGVKVVMSENIELALQNCVTLETIEQQAEELQHQAGVFKKNAVELRKRMWWKNLKMKLLIALIILIPVTILVVWLVVTLDKGDKDDGGDGDGGDDDGNDDGGDHEGGDGDGGRRLLRWW